MQNLTLLKHVLKQIILCHGNVLTLNFDAVKASFSEGTERLVKQCFESR